MLIADFLGKERLTENYLQLADLVPLSNIADTTATKCLVEKAAKEFS